MKAVYLIHFETAYEHARHYLGATVNLQQRMWQHANSTNARLLEVIADADIAWQLARVWATSDPFRLERYLKDRHNGLRLCPLCQPTTRPIKRVGVTEYPLELLTFPLHSESLKGPKWHPQSS